jgi:pseudouridine kinase
MPSVVCLGAVLIDEIFFCQEEVITATSNPAISKKNIGGVMSNIARHLSLLEIDVEFITVFGSDTDADFIKKNLLETGLSFQHSLQIDEPTGKYCAIHQPDGSLFTAACSDTLSKMITADFLQTRIDVFKNAEIIIADTNLEIEALEWLINFAFTANKKLIIEPVSVAKARKLSALDLNGLFMITPNQDEIYSIQNDAENKLDNLSMMLINRGVKQVWISLGEKGSIIYNGSNQIRLGVPQITIKDATGAGDAALAAWIFAYLNQFSEIDCLKIAHSFALEILQKEGAIDKSITKEKLLSLLTKYYHD